MYIYISRGNKSELNLKPVLVHFVFRIILLLMVI